jgi:hypothetical protein
LPTHCPATGDGYLRRPYDASPFTDYNEGDSYDEVAPGDARYPKQEDLEQLCVRMSPTPVEWPASSPDAPRLVLAHLGGKQNMESNSKRAAIEIAAGMRSRPPRVPGPFYLCQSPKHAWALASHVGDTTQQPSLYSRGFTAHRSISFSLLI